MSLGESVRKIDEFETDADIFDFDPWSAGKNVEWINAGFGKFKRGATSRVIRKYGSLKVTKFSYSNQWFGLTWSIAHGIKQANSCFNFSPKINGNDELTLGAAWMAGKAILPIESLSVKPKIPSRERLFISTKRIGFLPFTWLKVTHFWIRQIFR